MSFFTYILQSRRNGSFYVGQTQNLFKRLQRHNKGLEKYTRKFAPWNLVWCGEFDSRKEAYNCEQSLKKFKSRDRIIRFINQNLAVAGSENLQINGLLDFRES